MSMNPIRPFVAGQRDEAIGPFCVINYFEEFGYRHWIIVEWSRPPMVMIREGNDIKSCDVASVGEVILRSSRSVGEGRVAMKVAPYQPCVGFADDDWWQVAYEPFQDAATTHLQAERTGAGRRMALHEPWQPYGSGRNEGCL